MRKNSSQFAKKCLVFVCSFLAIGGYNVGLYSNLAYAHCPEGGECLPEEKARECLRLIEAGERDLLQSLRECESDLNRKTGAVNELRLQYRNEKQRSDDLSAEVGVLRKENEELQKRFPRWMTYVFVGGAILVGGAAGYGIKSLDE